MTTIEKWFGARGKFPSMKIGTCELGGSLKLMPCSGASKELLNYNWRAVWCARAILHHANRGAIAVLIELDAEIRSILSMSPCHHCHIGRREPNSAALLRDACAVTHTVLQNSRAVRVTRAEDRLLLDARRVRAAGLADAWNVAGDLIGISRRIDLLRESWRPGSEDQP